MVFMKKYVVLFIALIACPFVLNAQEQEEEDPAKQIREVIEVQMEKPKVAAPVQPAATETTQKGKKGKKKQVEETPPEEPPAEEGAMIPATVAELSKRAGNWTKAKNKKYRKDNVANSGNTITCVAVFVYKPKELNPVCDVEGEISMDVIIECKEGKYRYTIKNIQHTSRNPNVNGGDIYKDVAECGSIALNDMAWKQIKSAALSDANQLAQDLKAKMNEPGEGKKDEW